jgi:hypothetical protein
MNVAIRSINFTSQNIFNITTMDNTKPVIVISSVKFAELCLILDFAYLGQAQVPHDRLDDFIKAGELLQIRGIKEGRIHYMTNQTILQAPPPQLNRTVDSTISSTQETFTDQQPIVQHAAKRPREDDDISIQEASEIMKMLLDSNPDLEAEQVVQRTAPPPMQSPAVPNFIPRYTIRPPIVSHFMPRPPVPVKEKPKFFCRFCNRALSTQGRMKKHESECNGNPNRAVVECEICKQQLKPSSLASHKSQKHGLKGKGSGSPHPQTFTNESAIEQKITMEPSVVSEKITISPAPIAVSYQSPHGNNGNGSPPQTEEVLRECKTESKDKETLVVNVAK